MVAGLELSGVSSRLIGRYIFGAIHLIFGESMVYKIKTTDQYWKCLEEVYDPQISKKRANELLEGFLDYKSKTISSGTPQKAEDAIVHLQGIVSKSSNPLFILIKHPLISAFIAGIFILIIWQYIGPYFGAKT